MTRPELARRLGVAAGALLLLFAAWYFLTAPSRARKDAAKANATAVTADASKQAAQDSVRILVDTQAAHGRIDVVTSENRNAILAAPGAAEAVGSGVHDAGLRALCLRDAYRLQPTCRGLLDAGAAGAAPADTGGTAPR
jgi:hypothetical protein